MSAIHCLGLKILGECGYDPSAPNLQIISIGDALSAIALILTFSQLVTPILKLRVRRDFARVYILWGLAVLSVLLSALLPFVPGSALPLVGYPIFWELVGACCIIAGIIKLLVGFNKKLKFTSKTFHSTASLVVRGIAMGDERDHVELSFYLQKALKDLIGYSGRFDSFEAYRAEEEGRIYAAPELSREAGHILKLCSDESFCSAIVRKNPGFAIQLVSGLTHQNSFRNKLAKPLVWEIVRQAFLNTDSILYREKSYRGLGFAKGFTDAMFGNFEFVESYQPLSGLSLILEKNVSIEAVDRYGDVLKIITQGYLERGSFYEHSFAMFSSFGDLISFAAHDIHSIDRLDRSDIYKSAPYKIFSSVVGSVSECIKAMESDEALLEKDLIEYSSKVSGDRDYTPFKYAADWIYELLEGAARVHAYDSELRCALLEVWNRAYPHGTPTSFHLEVQRRLEVKIFTKLKINLEEGYYPAISRVLISLMGLQAESYAKSEENFRSRFLAYLSEKFFPLYTIDKERALDKIPSNVVFNIEKMQLEQTIRKGDVRVLRLKS